MSSPETVGNPSYPGTGETLFRVTDLHKSFRLEDKEIPVLKGVDMEIRCQETLAIVGASGVGKTTLHHILGALDRATRGRVLYRGEDLFEKSENELALFRNQDIGYVFQFHYLLAELSALENVELPLVFKGVGTKERHRRATEVLERVGLGDRTTHKPTELSGGQMQRCAIARALANSPALILADEPTGNLDTASGREIFDLFEELWKQGHTIMVITHDPNMPMRTERTLHLKDGLLGNGNGVDQPPPIL